MNLIYFYIFMIFSVVIYGFKYEPPLSIAGEETPSAVANSGKLYKKADNKLYYQDSSGVAYEVLLEGAYPGTIYTKADKKLYFQDDSGTEQELLIKD